MEKACVVIESLISLVDCLNLVSYQLDRAVLLGDLKSLLLKALKLMLPAAAKAIVVEVAKVSGIKANRMAFHRLVISFCHLPLSSV